MRTIYHLIDDTSPGGVTRFLTHMSTAPEHACLGDQSVVPVKTGLATPPKLAADVIVSHVVLSWKNLPFLLALRARHPGVPIIHMEHSYSPAFEQMHVTSQRRFRTMLTVSLSIFDKVVVISEAQRHWLSSSGIVDAAKTSFIPPCVDLTGFLDLPVPSSPIRAIGAFGRFDAQKGFDILIPAFRKAERSDLTLSIFGDGPDRGKLEALASDDPRIVFHGFVDDPVSAMRSVDAVAMPSRREPYGLVAVEALAAARTLLVSRVDGLIDHAKNGAVPVAQLSVDDWTRSIEEIDSVAGIDARTKSRRFAAEAGKRFVKSWRELFEELAS